MLNTKILEFLSILLQNNDRNWFNANKGLYEESKNEFEGFINKLIPQIIHLDNQIYPVEAKDCMFRIYKDTRFAKDKTPYKTNFGAWISNGGRKSVFPGYYIHIEPNGKSLVAGGVYMPPPEILKAVRLEIYENIDEFKAILSNPDFRKYFGDMENIKLRSAPKDFPKDFPDIELLKYKWYTVGSSLSDEVLTSAQCNNTILHLCEILKPFNQFLRRAFEE
jgi:uncharacterized protein (TIGR02453 family)